MIIPLHYWMSVSIKEIQFFGQYQHNQYDFVQVFDKSTTIAFKNQYNFKNQNNNNMSTHKEVLNEIGISLRNLYKSYVAHVSTARKGKIGSNCSNTKTAMLGLPQHLFKMLRTVIQHNVGVVFVIPRWI